MTWSPPPQPRAGIGEWPVWGDEPPELRFRPISAARLPTAPVPWPAAATGARPAPPGMALAGFILGLLGACFSWVPLVGLASSLFGAVLSTQARRVLAPGGRGRTLSTAGLVLGCVGVVFSVSSSAIFATIALNALFNAVYTG